MGTKVIFVWLSNVDTSLYDLVHCLKLTEYGLYVVNKFYMGLELRSLSRWNTLITDRPYQIKYKHCKNYIS